MEKTKSQAQTIKKDDLCKALAEKLSCPKTKANEIVDAVTDVLREFMVECNTTVRWPGLGTFGTRVRKASVTQSIHTKKPVKVGERSVIYFRPSSDMKEAVKNCHVK